MKGRRTVATKGGRGAKRRPDIRVLQTHRGHPPSCADSTVHVDAPMLWLHLACGGSSDGCSTPEEGGKGPRVRNHIATKNIYVRFQFESYRFHKITRLRCTKQPGLGRAHQTKTVFSCNLLHTETTRDGNLLNLLNGAQPLYR